MSAASRRVLVADDDPTVALLARAALAGSGFETVVVDNGTAALVVFQRESFDLALLDVEMPGLDGFEVSAAIRQLRGSDFPIVLVTGHDDADFIRRAGELAVDYLAKPLDWRQLPALLSGLLARA